MSTLIYLAGGITGLTKEEMSDWRTTIKGMIEDLTSGRWKCVDPTQHIPTIINRQVEKECMTNDVETHGRASLRVFIHLPCHFDRSEAEWRNLIKTMKLLGCIYQNFYYLCNVNLEL